MKLTKLFLLFLVVVSLTVSLQNIKLVNASSKTLIVPDTYPTIQEAINNADAGDTIYIKHGTYVENPVVNRSVCLIGENRDTTVIDVTAGLKVESDNVTITGLTIYDGWQGITLTSNYSTIKGNKITNAQYGIVLHSSQNNIITENLISQIEPSAAIQLSYSNNNLIKNNFIESCMEGIQLRAGSSNNLVTENSINNCQDTAIRLMAEYSPPRMYNPNNNTIIRNNISNSGYGTIVYGSSNNTISNNNYINNTLQFSANEEYYLTFGGSRSVNTINANYWSDYNGTDANKDGIGDTPYVIDAYNKDNSPLKSLLDISIQLPLPSTVLVTPSPSVPEFSIIVILPLFLVALLAVLLVKSKARFLGRF